VTTQNEVLIVSAFGRGHWLAAELARKKMKVLLLEVSGGFGHWSPEDIEGPFGFFQSEFLTETQITRMTEEDYRDSVPEGFVVWPKSGPLDTAGPISAELMRKWGVGSDQIETLRKGGGPTDKNFWQRPFHEVWFTHLCHSLALPCFVDNARSAEFGKPLTVFAPHMVRRVSRRGFDQSLNWVGSWGAEVLEKVKLVDVTIQGRDLIGVEISSEWSGFIRTEQVIWCLSSEETEHLNRSVREKIMPGEVVRPLWQWQRFRFRIGGSDIHKDMPLHFVMIEDLGLPWSHDNLCVVQRCVTGTDYDLWLRLPSSQRFHRQYLEEKGEKALRHLARRLPGCELEMTGWPIEATYDATLLGPSRFPLFHEKQIFSSGKRGHLSNVQWSNPESWVRIDASGIFEQQNILNANIDLWKHKKEEALRKAQGAEGPRP